MNRFGAQNKHTARDKHAWFTPDQVRKQSRRMARVVDKRHRDYTHPRFTIWDFWSIYPGVDGTGHLAAV